MEKWHIKQYIVIITVMSMFCLAAQVMALVPYNEESIPVLYKPQRQFSFLGHALTIAPVSYTHLTLPTTAEV